MKSIRKLVTAFNEKAGKLSQSDFLVPICLEGEIRLFGLHSKKIFEKGMVVYVGRDVSTADLFAKLVDSKCVIPDVKSQLAYLDQFFDSLSGFKIGEFVRLLGLQGASLEKTTGIPLMKKVNIP
ncbi:MAG: hypothetical protein IPN71_17630 [Fibrobacteres bacterium]|nr:hypothetical protein [Fibrobacterota bacterium]